ncbi:MAG: flagellar basal-body rod protein FlgG [Nitrospinae bacterium]|nr:flagellar basal-body rod protein FlgG [Nitrospinota bacterium]
MIRSLYTGATGMAAMSDNISVIANNLANTGTTGFKKSRAEFQDLLYQTSRMPGTDTEQGTQVPTGLQIGVGVQMVATAKSFAQGALAQTSNQLDLAIQGQGLFQVLQPDGTTAYTRAGSFQLDSTGTMVTPNGQPLEPIIKIPNNALSVTVSQTGQVSVLQPGSVAPAVIGQIQLAAFANAPGLLSLGNSLYKETAASGSPQVGAPGSIELGTVIQGSIESSNVNVVEELTNMIMAQRAYEMNSKCITTSDQMMQTANALKT